MNWHGLRECKNSPDNNTLYGNWLSKTSRMSVNIYIKFRLPNLIRFGLARAAVFNKIDLGVLLWAEKLDWRPAGPAPVHCFLSQ